MTLQFTAMANRTYSIVGASAVDAELWFNVTNVQSAPTNRVIFVESTSERNAILPARRAGAVNRMFNRGVGRAVLCPPLIRKTDAF